MEKKEMLFKTALKTFKRYDETTDTTRARSLWSEYYGLIKAVEIFGWVSEFVAYAKENGWDVTLP